MPIPGKLYKVYCKRQINIGESDESIGRRYKLNPYLYQKIDGTYNYHLDGLPVSVSHKEDVVMFISYNTNTLYPFVVLYKNRIGWLASRTVFEQIIL